MAETHPDNDTMELEFSEEDVAYYIEDEDGNEVGIALYDENGNEVEYYYADAGDVEYVEIEEVKADGTASEDAVDELVELEFSEEDVAYYIEDEDGNEIGFALYEDGAEVEYYYEGVDADAYAAAPAVAASKTADAAPSSPAKSTNAQPFARRAGEEVGKLATKAGAGASQAAAAAKDTARKIKEGVSTKKKAEEDDEDLGFGLTSGQVKHAAGEFTSLAKEGAEAAAELRGVYNDIFGELDFLKPSASSRTTRNS